MDSTIRICGLLDALVPGTEAHARLKQKERELEFYGILRELMDCHPNFVLPENEMTPH
jgi:type IV secretory pathway VirD2 relaxase